MRGHRKVPICRFLRGGATSKEAQEQEAFERLTCNIPVESEAASVFWSCNICGSENIQSNLRSPELFFKTCQANLGYISVSAYFPVNLRVTQLHGSHFLIAQRKNTRAGCELTRQRHVTPEHQPSIEMRKDEEEEEEEEEEEGWAAQHLRRRNYWYGRDERSQLLAEEKEVTGGGGGDGIPTLQSFESIPEDSRESPLRAKTREKGKIRGSGPGHLVVIKASVFQPPRKGQQAGEAERSHTAT
ncbi:hypothetical protein EYF80_027325 [Liparis tanakae]|uniref:Uncharacterized protein n=1 Tax=Liparis tanakae TaxID=230148 RepID=A0A4Z2H951_9TELE|nr:hypothetical protein EYF80_027325 [Liparis tanakae]